MTVIDFEHERAQRRGSWIDWADRQPANDVVFRIKLSWRDDKCANRYVRRDNQIFVIEDDGRLVRVADGFDGSKYSPSKWMPG